MHKRFNVQLCGKHSERLKSVSKFNNPLFFKYIFMNKIPIRTRMPERKPRIHFELTSDARHTFGVWCKVCSR